VFRLLVLLVLLCGGVGGMLFVDYQNAARRVSAAGDEQLTLTQYLGDLPARLPGLAGATSSSGLPTKLADMMPKPPEGWTLRPTVAEDAEPFLPKNTKKTDKAALAYVSAVAKEEGGSGTESALLTFERGDRRVIVKAVRYSDSIFTNSSAIEERLALQSVTARFRGTEFMTVRGLDVSEDLLPEEFRGRYFLADVGSQIHLRLLAPKRMKDEEVMAFFETLNVAAMNASVVQGTDGLGEVPVMVLASALDPADREIYVAELAKRKTEAAAANEKTRLKAEAMAKEAKEAAKGGGLLDGLFGGGDNAEAPPAEPAAQVVDCTKNKDGVKRCTITDGAPAED
jgi:hypothetical protein